MKKQKLLSVFVDGNDEIKMWMPDSDNAVIAISNYIFNKAVLKNNRPLDVLFSVTVHVLARDITGKSLDDYTENLKKVVPIYIDALKKAIEQEKAG